MAAAMVLALPPTLACALVGQNGFFSAALFGALLLWLPRRPLLAGVALGVLAFKPQRGARHEFRRVYRRRDQQRQAYAVHLLDQFEQFRRGQEGGRARGPA